MDYECVFKLPMSISQPKWGVHHCTRRIPMLDVESPMLIPAPKHLRGIDFRNLQK